MLATCEDLHGSFSVLLFQSDQFQDLAPLFEDDNIVTIKRVRYANDRASVNCQSVELISSDNRIKDVHLDLPLTKDLNYLEPSNNLFRKSRYVDFILHGNDTDFCHKKFWSLMIH